MEKERYFAELLGAFTGDGWISKRNTGLSLFITGNPKDEQEYYNRIKFLFKKSFLIDVKPRQFYYWKTFGVCVGKAKIIEKFVDYGMPIGKKSHIVDVPNFIMSNKKLHKDFIRGLFDTDGCIYFQKSYNSNASKWQKEKRHRPTLIFFTVSKKLSISLKEMLDRIGFKFRVRERNKNKTTKLEGYELRLEGKKNVKKFYDNIKPGNSKHIQRFSVWLKQGFY